MTATTFTQVAYKDIGILATDCFDVQPAIEWVWSLNSGRKSIFVVAKDPSICHLLAEYMAAVRKGQEVPTREWSRRRLIWSSGTTVTLIPANEPHRLQGPLCDVFWAHEPESWEQKDVVWRNLLSCWCLKPNGKGLVTTDITTLSSFVDFFVKNTPGLVKDCPSTTNNKPHTRVKQCIKCGYQGTWHIRWLGDMSGQSTTLLAECKECSYQETWPTMDAEPKGGA